MSRKKKNSREKQTDVKFLAEEAGAAFRELESAATEPQAEATSDEIQPEAARAAVKADGSESALDRDTLSEALKALTGLEAMNEKSGVAAQEQSWPEPVEPGDSQAVEGLNLSFSEDEGSESELSLADSADANADQDAEAEAQDSEAALAEDGLTQMEASSLASPEATDDDSASDSDDSSAEADSELAGTELETFEAAQIEDVEVLTEEQIRSVVESVLFSTDKPVSVAVIKQAFKGTQVRSKDIRDALSALIKEYDESNRGFALDEIAGGFQLRTKPDNMKYLRQSVKARPFKLSGPALEVLSICAYKQPVTKAQIDEIRGVESGHLLRALMEKHLLTFGERSDLPGKPMFYETTRKFLEIFGLRNLQELPSLSEIDQLIPEGIGDVEEKESLSDLTGKLSQAIESNYSVGEEELLKITDELSQITTSSDFFEQEKQRIKDQRDKERAQDVRDAIALGEPVEDKDRKWLGRYEQSLIDKENAGKEVEFVTEALSDASAEDLTEDSAEGSIRAAADELTEQDHVTLEDLETAEAAVDLGEEPPSHEL